jgi:hypothetical protein
MSRLSIAACGLSALAIAVAGLPAAAATPGGAVSGQTLTNSVGTQNLPVDPSSLGSQAQGSTGGDLTGGAALPADVLGGSTSGVGVVSAADPAKWDLKHGLGDPLVMSADFALKSKGYQGGLAGQGIDPAQITDPLAFQGVMPSQGGMMPAQMGSELPAAASSVTSLFHLGN